MPLVALADELPGVPEGPMQQLFNQLPATCAPLSLRLGESARRQLRAFYWQQGDQPLWSDDGRLAALQGQVAQLIDDGLDPQAYPLPAQAPAASDSCADLEISQQYLQALHDLHFGRVSQARLEPVWHGSTSPPLDRQVQLLAIAVPGVHDVPAAFDQARPGMAYYQQLRQAYAQLRQQPLAQWSPLASGPLLRPDKQDARVPALAQRLFSEGYLATPEAMLDNTYSGELVEAVKAFQLSHSLQADGVIGPGTLKELNISPDQRREQLRLNLERFRWMARDLEPTSLLVNVAAAELTVYQAGAAVWQTRTQVGRAERQTPLLKSQVTRLTLNPTWTIPPTILKEDKLPEIRRDQAFLSKHDLQVLDSNGLPLAPEDVDWERPGNILLRQGPGVRNPLGQMVVRFPNPFSVYLHDTPSQALFSKGPRAFSSGCVRIEHALQLRDWLMTPAERTRTDQLLSSGQTHEFRLPAPIPILMTYWTVQADAQGQLRYSPDIYALDAALTAALASAH